jgi:hypothetical protein
MMSLKNRARWALAAFAVGPLLVTGCYVKDQLLEPQNPGTVGDEAVGTAAAALALRVGAIGRIRNVVNGGDERLWQEIGHITDEYKDADFQPSRIDIDRRTITTNNGNFPYQTVTQQRGFLRDAIEAMQKYAPDSLSLIGELYMGLAFIEMSLAENYCNGIPLGHTHAGEVTLGPGLTNAQVFDTAAVHLDSAVSFVNAHLAKSPNDVGARFVLPAVLVLRARVFVDQGKFAQAAALVSATAVPTSYQYLFTTSATNGGLDDNGHWNIQINTTRVTVGDSFDLIGAAPNIVKNALPFVSAKDPRVPTRGPTGTAEDGSTPMFVNLIYSGRKDPMPMASGIDARLIEAEAKLNADDIAGMMTILNGLRTSAQRLGNLAVPVMSTLATPANKEAAVSLYFREKAFWVWGRGQRLSDLRRLMRQYGRPEDQVFPTGKFSYAGNLIGDYGHDVNFPIPDPELPNPNFKGCLDRKP